MRPFLELIEGVVKVYHLLIQIISNFSTWLNIKLQLGKRNCYFLVYGRRNLPYLHAGFHHNVCSCDILAEVELFSPFRIRCSADPDGGHAVCDFRFHQKCGGNVGQCSLAGDEQRMRIIFHGFFGDQLCAIRHGRSLLVLHRKFRSFADRAYALPIHQIQHFIDLVHARLCCVAIAVIAGEHVEVTRNDAFQNKHRCHQVMCQCELVVRLIFAVCADNHTHAFVVRHGKCVIHFFHSKSFLL